MRIGYVVSGGGPHSTREHQADVGVGREEPGMDDVRLEPLEERTKSPGRYGIEPQPLLEHGDGNASRGQVFGIRAAARQRHDLHLELISRQVRGQQSELLLRTRAVKRRNDQGNPEHEGGRVSGVGVVAVNAVIVDDLWG